MRVYFQMLEAEATREEAVTCFVTVGPAFPIRHEIIDVKLPFV